MKPVLPAALIATALLLLVGCKHKRKWAAPEPLDSIMSSRIEMSDPLSAYQLVGGFYDLNDVWRWTAKDFSVKLGIPAHAAQRGARLEAELVVADTMIQNLKSITLYAVINGLALPSKTYNTPGQCAYSHDVPADRLNSSSNLIEFHLDKALRPKNGDARELGIIVRSLGLEAR